MHAEEPKLIIIIIIPGTWKFMSSVVVMTPIPLVSWHEFGCHDDANAQRKSTKEADKHKKFLLQFRK